MGQGTRPLLPLLVLFATSFLLLEAEVCWKQPYCNCYQGQRPAIYCRYVRNVSDILPLLRKHTSLYRIRLQGSFRTLPSGAFEGQSVAVIQLDAPLGSDLPPDALRGVRELTTLELNRTAFEEIPVALLAGEGVRARLRYFQSVSGELKGLDAQLQNMTACSTLVLSRNSIAEVSEDAFLGSRDLQTLDLSRNQIVGLSPVTFLATPFLKTLDLSHNRLHTVQGCFVTLNPTSINLYSNNLTSVDNVFHRGMWNLKYLNLGGNPGINVTSTTFNATLKALTELHLSDDSIDSVDPSLLRNLWNLHKLYLNNNNISSIPKYFLEHTPFITTLELSNNHLKTVEHLLDHVKEWYNSLKLKLDGNELTSASVGNSRITIYSVDFSRNQISSIRAEDMKRLNTVEYLNLSRNDIRFLEEGSFSSFNSLQYLDLSYNPLTSLNRTLHDLPKLHSVHIRSCLLETLTEEDFEGCQKISYIDLRNNSLSDVHGAFQNMKNINKLDISFNNLTTLTTDSFPPFQKTSIRVQELYMANNSWSCDCRLAWVVDWVTRKGSRLKDDPVCSSPTHLEGIPIRTLNRTDFEMWKEDCPEMCECLCKAEGQEMYTEVQCLHKGLKEVPKTLPPNARSLDLSGNTISSFDGHDVLQLEQLDRVNLENNRIKEIQLVLPPKLSSIRLAYNSLRTFPTEWVGNVSFTLSRNPWACNCDTWAFRNWLLQHNDSIMDLYEIRCSDQESFSLRNKPIILLTRSELCSFLTSIVINSVSSALFLILCLIGICYWKSLAAFFYSCGCRCLKRSQNHDYPYDAFLMYSEEDESLAMGEIAKDLESERHRFILCIPTRDIPSPRTAQKVTAYLPQCTKVIVLLTRNFIENEECKQLLLSALSFSTESSSKNIIFVTEGDLPPTSELDPVLKNLLKNCTSLKWGQCLFWQKLTYQLPKKGSRNREYDVEDEPLMQ